MSKNNAIKKFIKDKFIKEFDKLTPETLDQIANLIKNNHDDNRGFCYFEWDNNINIEKKETPTKMNEQRLIEQLGNLMDEKLNKALEPIRSDISEIKVRVTNLENDMADVKVRLTNVENDMAEVKVRLTNVEENVKSLKKEANKKGWKI